MASLATRIAVVLPIAGAFIALFGLQLLDAFAGEGWQRLALAIEQGSQPISMSSDRQKRLASRLTGDPAGLCTFEIAQSRVTVGLDLLRRRLAERSAHEAKAAIVLADNLIRDAIACSPTDANLWYLRALLLKLRNEDARQVQSLLVISAGLAPFEADPLRQRSLLEALLLQGPSATIVPPLTDDLRNAMQFLRVAEANEVLHRLRMGGREALADRLLASLSEERQQILSGKVSKSTFGRGERYRHFEFTPFGTNPNQ